MNLKQIDAAIAAYRTNLDEGDNARLAFFRKLWEAMDEASQAVLAEKPEGGFGFDEGVLEEARRNGVPALSLHPASVDASLLARTIERVAACMAKEGGYAKGMCDGLTSRKWDRLVNASDIALAGKEPDAYLDSFFELLSDDGLDERTARMGALAASLALRAVLEPYAAEACRVLGSFSEEALSPLRCPVCGGEAGAARVGVTKHSDGRGKELWCPQCGAVWEFERVRCARCGTQNQSHLHYFNIEGDDAHRLATCDECGGFMRTVYQDSALAPFAFEVEDVVMARLDLLALQEATRSAKQDTEAS